MASAFPKQSATDSTHPIRDSSNEPLLDYIRQSAKSIHRTELTVGLLSWLVMGLGTIFIFVLIDHWVLPFNGVLRYAVWLLLVGGSLIWLFFRVAPLIGRSINPEYAAKRIEDTIPEMKGGLISWLQLASNGSTPRGVLNAVGRYVAKHLQGQDVASVIDQFASMKLAAILFGMTLISAIYIAVSPKSGIATISRLIMPWADIAPSTRVQILSLTPGDATVTEGSNLLIALQVRGWHRGDVARIRFSTDDGQSVDQTVAMQAEIEGITYVAELGKSFGGLVQPMHYYVEAGDAKAGPFAIRIQAVPLVVLERVEYNYPTYMRLVPRVTEGDGRIEAPEGTRVTVHARSNQAIKKARIEYDTKPEKDASFRVASVDDVTIEDRSIAASIQLKLDELKSNPSLLNYRIRSENDRGEVNVEPVVYPIKVIPDLAPEVQLASELKELIDLPVNQKINIEVRAMDPDFGLQRLSISGTVNNQNVIVKELFRNESGILAQVSEVYSFDPVLLRLQPGMQSEIMATAEDNRRAVGSDQLEPNIRQSRVIRIRITPPSDVPADASADKNRSADSTSTNKTEGGKSTKEKDKNPTQDNKTKNAGENSKANNKDKQGDNRESKTSSNDGNKQPNNSQDDGKSESPLKSDSPDSADKESKNGNQVGNPQQNPPKSGGKNASPDSKQGQQGQGVQENDPSNAEKSDKGQSGAGKPSTGEKQPGGAQEGGSEGGNESPSGQGAESGKSTSGGKSQPSRGAGQRGEPMHDGEAFEELQDALPEDAEPGKANGAGKSTNRQSPESNQSRSSKSDDPPSGKGKPSSEKSSDAQSNSSDRNPGSPGQPSSSSSGSDNKNSSANEPSTQDAPSKNGSQDKQPSNSNSTQQGKQGQSNSEKQGQQGQGEKRETESQASKNGIENADSSDAKSPNSGDDSELPNSNAIKGSGKEESNASKGKESDDSAGEKGSGKSAKPKGKESGTPSSENGEPGTAENGSDSSDPSATKGQQGKQGKAEQGKPTTQSKGQDGSTGDQPSDSGQASKSSSKAGKSTKDSTGNRMGNNRPGNDDSANEADDASPANAEQATAEVEYARQATDMVLKALERQRDQPDPELLKRMGWNKEQLQAFLDRWKNAREQAASNPQKKREYDESLRSLGLMPNTGTARNEKGHDDRLRGLNEEGSRTRPPESLRERFEAFRKSTIFETSR